MPEQNDDTQNPEGQTPEGQTPEGDKPEGQTPEGDKPAEDELPEWARKELTKARGDAASYRTRLREAEAKLAEAKTPEDIEAAVADLKAANADLERQIVVRDVAAKHNLPPALAKRLTGSTPEELEADAKELAKLVAPAPTTPSSPAGGLNPGDNDDSPSDPRTLARVARRR